MDEVKCTGTEHSLLDCSYPGVGRHDCTHPEDASVTCGCEKFFFLCVCVCVCVCVRARARALSLVSMNKILRFINTVIIMRHRA